VLGSSLPRWLQRDRVHTLRAPSLLSVEGAPHTRYRKAVSGLMSPKAVAALRGQLERTITGLLNELEPGELDIVERYCTRLPVAVLSDIMGAPDQFSGVVSPSLDLGVSWKQYRQGQKGVADFMAWLAAQPRGDNLISQLMEAAEAHLPDTEFRGVAALTLGGFESAANLMASGIRALLDHPEQLDTLRRRPEVWPNAVDETLRLESPVQFTARRAVRDTDIGSRHLKRGDLVLIYIGAVNRDPSVFSDPHRFNVERPNAGRHLTFSGGRHMCPGKTLARALGEYGLQIFFDRFPAARLVGPGTRRTSMLLRGWATLPVTLGELGDAPTSRAATASRAAGVSVEPSGQT
jgi:cytochrome P450